jgi:hypothetical protein
MKILRVRQEMFQWNILKFLSVLENTVGCLQVAISPSRIANHKLFLLASPIPISSIVKQYVRVKDMFLSLRCSPEMTCIINFLKTKRIILTI